MTTAPSSVLRALDLTVRRRVEGLLAGDHPSALLGVGTELAQVRPYQPGDDVRRIDWNVTARTMEPHVRVHVSERALTTWLVLDGSPSMAFGTADRTKADLAEGVALAVGHLACRGANRLGVIGFGGRSPLSLPPTQGRAGLLGLLSAPAGAAHRLTANPYKGLALSAALALVAMWGGLTLSYLVPSLPPSSMIISLAMAIYVVAALGWRTENPKLESVR